MELRRRGALIEALRFARSAHADAPDDRSVTRSLAWVLYDCLKRCKAGLERIAAAPDGAGGRCGEAPVLSDAAGAPAAGEPDAAPDAVGIVERYCGVLGEVAGLGLRAAANAVFYERLLANLTGFAWAVRDVGDPVCARLLVDTACRRIGSPLGSRPAFVSPGPAPRLDFPPPGPARRLFEPLHHLARGDAALMVELVAWYGLDRLAPKDFAAPAREDGLPGACRAELVANDALRALAALYREGRPVPAGVDAANLLDAIEGVLAFRGVSWKRTPRLLGRALELAGMGDRAHRYLERPAPEGARRVYIEWLSARKGLVGIAFEGRDGLERHTVADADLAGSLEEGGVYTAVVSPDGRRILGDPEPVAPAGERLPFVRPFEGRFEPVRGFGFVHRDLPAGDGAAPAGAADRGSAFAQGAATAVPAGGQGRSAASLAGVDVFVPAALVSEHAIGGLSRVAGTARMVFRDGTWRYEAARIERVDPAGPEAAERVFEGEARLQPGGYAFVGDCLVGRDLVASAQIRDGQLVRVRARRSWNRPRRAWGWSAVALA